MWRFGFESTLFSSRVDEVAVRAALGRTVAHKVAHNSGLERAKRKVERPRPAPIVAGLEQTLYTVS